MPVITSWRSDLRHLARSLPSYGNPPSMMTHLYQVGRDMIYVLRNLKEKNEI